MKQPLSKVYLDDAPITLLGNEARPPLSRIVRAGGKDPDGVDVLSMAAATAATGHLLGPEDVIDRTAEPTRPIYLRTVNKDVQPILTRARKDLAVPDPPMPLTARHPMPNVDPVISQLGKNRPDRPFHEEGVFRSPVQLAQAEAAVAAVAAAQLARRARAEALAVAEAEAEQRQEDDRNQADALQDELDDQLDADEDSESQG